MMTLHQKSGILTVAAAWLFSIMTVSAQEQPTRGFSDNAETERLRSLGSRALGLPLGTDAEFHAVGNLIGFRSKEFLFSQRLDSRTYFFQDLRTETRAPEAKPLPEEEVLKSVRVALHALDVPASEIGEQ